MFEFLRNLIPFGNRAQSQPTAAPSEADGPSLQRDRLVEGSAEPTFLRPDKALEHVIIRLNGLGVEIRYGDNEERDLVHDLRDGFKTGAFPRLTQAEQYLARHTIDRIAGFPDSAIAERAYILGQIDAVDLLTACDLPEFVRRLTHDYPGYRNLVPEFDTTAIVGRNFTGKVITQDTLDALTAPRKTSIGAERDAQSRFDLLRIITETFDDISEPMSYGRLRLISPYVPGLAHCPADRRYEIVRKIFADEYPFNRDNRDNWHSEIGTAMNP